MASTSHNPFYAAMQPQAQHWGATSPTSTGAGYDRPSAGYPAYTGYAAAGTSHPAPSSSSPSTALALYNPSSLYGLYYNEAVHGPFATGLQSNPFTPGLAPLSTVSRPSYATEDPLRQRYPATSANPHDPLNWITEDLFAIRMERAAISQQRTPLRSASVAAR
uniref:Allantoicase n=2 Tax=Chlamydomonas reinhardtii TaxID=3055 RepID=ALLC_CHLRE|nr:RecName: Full=Allantoicase; AltName: Full=Allantoate amidinohydrolase; AltName: Full=Protein EARLY ZYGOTE EXPRESSED 3 [Chlamydomonas reinhardtii]BAF46276.1 hypothetical protein [Chlamydomonas reinhardtii]|eukprot:XP_001697407.1 predicted protein [Chlamydomonas reinhardtii]